MDKQTPMVASTTTKAYTDNSILSDIDLNLKSNDSASQRQRILKHLQSGKSLTTIQTRSELQIMHPAMRIKELRNVGYNIETFWASDETKEQGKHRVAMYYLKSGVIKK